ncbi:hypothetical protein Cgig2_002196 [Carnegiea gigantea]|uniref:non-specific serine/threonine protein kinase n=1 Tax=Carnegiea gigantea TaxID=171969 RepID=A0A9Q1QR09_9CARY|nr:hypothetical protein Cgig2_002196 [Carnegiea gigantea]
MTICDSPVDLPIFPLGKLNIRRIIGRNINSISFAVAALRSLKSQWQNTPPNWVKRDPCGRRWEGIVCSGSRVTAIILPGTNLAGSLPEDILSLSELQILDLSNNKGLGGPLPSKIGTLKNLVNLVLIRCNFSGPIPESIGSLQKLKSLFLNSNNFTGSIPHSVGNLRNLVWLDLSDNQLDGPIPVSNKTAPGLDLLLNAQHFHLGQNKLSGEVPLGLFSSKMSLIHVRFDGNSLSGPVPKNLNTLTSVTELYLSNNNLGGQILDLTGMNLLTYVDMSNNSFDRSGVPQWFTTLPNLTTLRMDNTGLEGPIPAELFNLPQIQTVVLRNNKLNGSVNMATSFSSDLRLIDLQNNSIDEFGFGQYRHKVLLEDNPFCRKPEAAGICKAIQAPLFPNFTAQQYCAALSCFSDQVGSDCTRPYLGSLIFRSFNFSDLENLFYYDFLMDTLQPLLAHLKVPVDKVCLISSMINMYGYLVLNIAFSPPGGAFFNRTGISTIGHVLNNHDFISPYGPYYFTDLPYPSFPGTSKNTGLIIGITVCGFVLVVLTISAGVYAYRQRKIANQAAKLNNPFSSWNQGNHPQLKGAKWFSFEDIKQFTDNFSERREIGNGGYGKVFKGKLNTGQLVAIKRAKQGSLQGALEFKTEIELLSRVHHKNVVNLVGFCYDKGEQMLIYEYVRNGSLRETLSDQSALRSVLSRSEMLHFVGVTRVCNYDHGYEKHYQIMFPSISSNSPLIKQGMTIAHEYIAGRSGIWLNWPRRLHVAVDAARGLAYLHELADPPIIHRDIKSDNILLDDQLNAKVADFGLSIPLSGDRDHVTTQVKGTMGYLDPEYYMTQILTEKSDVYGFGVVMLELVTGKLPIEKNMYIVREVKEALKETGNIYNLVDHAISADTMTGVKEFVDLAMRCVEDTGDKRPSMSEVVKEIENIIQASDFKAIVGSTTTSTSFEGAGSGVHPYNSSSSSFGITGTNPFLR